MYGGEIRPYRTHRKPHPNARRRPSLGAAKALLGTTLFIGFGYLVITSSSEVRLVSTVVLASLAIAAVAVVRRRHAPTSGARVGELSRDNRSIVRRATSGNVLSKIDLEQPFEWQLLDSKTGDSFYRLYQGASTLDFDLSDTDGPAIVVDLLGSSLPGRPFG